MTDPTFTAEELAAEAEREVRYRQWVYSTLVEKGKLSEQLARRRIQMMCQIAQDYRQKATTERLI